MHEKFNEIDMVIARGGFNTFQYLYKNGYIFEKNNPDKRKLKMVSENDKLEHNLL